MNEDTYFHLKHAIAIWHATSTGVTRCINNNSSTYQMNKLNIPEWNKKVGSPNTIWRHDVYCVQTDRVTAEKKTPSTERHIDNGDLWCCHDAARSNMILTATCRMHFNKGFSNANPAGSNEDRPSYERKNLQANCTYVLHTANNDIQDSDTRTQSIFYRITFSK